MDYAELPIDIQVGKLLDWLIDRRFCDRTWARNKTSIDNQFDSFYSRIPDEIRNSMSNDDSNYYKLVALNTNDILKDDKLNNELKNLLQIYQNNGYHLAENGFLLANHVLNEIPSLRKTLSQIDQDIKLLNAKQQTHSNQITSLEKLLSQKFTILNIKGENIENEINNKETEIKTEISNMKSIILQLSPLIESISKNDSIQKLQELEILKRIDQQTNNSEELLLDFDLRDNQSRSRLLCELLFIQAFLKQKSHENKQTDFYIDINDDQFKDINDPEKYSNIVDQLISIINGQKMSNLLLLVYSETFRTRTIINLNSITKKIAEIKNNSSNLAFEQHKLENEKSAIISSISDVIQKSKVLRNKVSNEISKKYNNRYVNIMADIN